ncbi:MAG TPA: VWA domain-containing protein [Pyrinomonadaceae bacterium]|nr:VWA domain-containing protein [Pyrinomonadaceae bacterium]
MQSPKSFVLRVLLFAALLLSAAHVAPVRAQGEQDDEVLRIKTELVQTDLMVFDKQGRFVEGLGPEQFELTLDGKPRPVSFFERIVAGSNTEAAQLAAMPGGAAAKSAGQSKAPPSSPGAGRVIFFFLDDLHLNESSLARARQALAEFVETEMGQDDRVAIVSASGQVGFLQQLTDYKPMLREAISRLKNKRVSEAYSGRTQITEYQANQVTEHNNRALMNYLIVSVMNEFQLVAPKGGDSRGLGMIAANVVRNRTRQIDAESKMTTANLLEVLESLMLSSTQLPGRKLVFFISDGFVVDERGSGSMTLLKRVTEMAARTNVVVYTMDARGTFNDPAVDAGRNDFPEGMGTGATARNLTMEASAMQTPLHILAEGTGGRAILNSNSFRDAFRQGVNETSNYYLLAWRPETEEQRAGRARIKVSVKGRPDLRVRLRRSYYAPPPAEKAGEKSAGAAKGKALTPEAELLAALGGAYPRRTLPVALSAGYLNTAEQGLALKVSMQVERGALDVATGEAQKSEVDVIGAAIDDRGVVVSFKQVLTLAADPSAQNEREPVVWHQQLKLPPGLYQVRVAVRERASGRTGSAQQWVDVPDVPAGRFQLSSLFFGERKAARPDEKFATAVAGPRPVMVDVDRRFPRSSVLRFQTYVYNAPRGGDGGAAPDVEIQARVLSGDRPVMTVAPTRLPADTTKDLTRLPYWSEIALDKLPPGKYVLQVTALDRKTRGSASQQCSFVIE